LRLQAEALGNMSGIGMEVWSTEAALQFYAGGGLDGSVPRHNGKQGFVYQRWGGFCLEPQPYPNAPNQPDFPSAVLRPGDSLKGRIEYRFVV
jgi:aldose 1-epimerase